MSMTTRNFSLIPGDSILAAPGPGQYDPRAPQDKVKVTVFVLFNKYFHCKCARLLMVRTLWNFF